MVRSSTTALLAIAATIPLSTAWPQFRREPSAATKKYKYVLAFSADGLHSSDIGKYVALRPKSTIASLLETGYEYSDAFTSAPSDSFPGILAQYTGAGPATHGVWYDDTWDRSIYAPGSNCTGPPGGEALYDESLDYNDTMIFSGGLNPASFPMGFVNGVCEPIYPHMRLRVNTVFEVARAAGLQTVYADKHPAYDIVRGPSGTGLSEGYFPEMAATPNTVNGTIAYDQLHVNAWLEWINGITPVNASITSGGSKITGMPAIMGGNFQCVSVAQKTVEYDNDSSLSTGILKAIDFVDSSLGQIVAKLKKKGYFKDSLIIVASKHGQAPIDPKLWNEVDPGALVNATSKPIAWLTTDDIGLMFLNHSSDTAAVVADLMAQKDALKINETISGAALIAQGFGDPTKDPAVPDIIIRPNLGTCYYRGKAKTAEHGGLSDDDRKVACFVSNPSLKKTVYSRQVSTKQVAPTILKALGLNPRSLKGVVAERTELLPGF